MCGGYSMWILSYSVNSSAAPYPYLQGIAGVYSANVTIRVPELFDFFGVGSYYDPAFENGSNVIFYFVPVHSTNGYTATQWSLDPETFLQ